MKLFDASPDLIKAVKEVMEGKKMSKDDIAALAGDKKKFEADDLAALRAGKHKHKKKHHVKEDAEIVEADEVPMAARTLYAQTYIKNYNSAIKKNPHRQASAKAEHAAYVAVENKHGKDCCNKLKSYHQKNMKEDVEIINEIGDTPAGLARLKGYVDVQSAKQGPSMWIGKKANMVYKAKEKIENNTPLEHEPKVHDFRHMDDGSIYNRSQTDDKIKDGDVFHMSGNRVGFMYKAWPTMLHGDSEALHSFNPGKSAPPRYKASVAKANELKNMKEETEVAEGSTYGVSTPLKTKGTYTSENGRHVAKVRRDRDWNEWRVELHTDGKHQKKADYHTDDKEEAHDQAKAMVAHAQKHEKPLKEAVHSDAPSPKPTSYDDGKSGFTPKGDKKGIVKKIINKYTK